MRVGIFVGLVLLTMAACALPGSRPYQFSEQYQNGERYQGVRLHGSLLLSLQTADGRAVDELSGLAWDAQQAVLYACSDEGWLFQLRPQFDDAHTLSGVELLAAYPLQDAQGRPLSGAAADSEGMVLQHTATGLELWLSFERQPRIERYRADGTWLGTLPLPAILANASHYQSKNKMLEALAWHPQAGVITAPEWPLSASPADKITLYALNGARWTVPRSSDPNSAVVGLETLADGSLLILERAYSSPFSPLRISLRRVTLNDSCQDRPVDCPVSQVAVFDSAQDWRVDNFEGLAHHQGRFLFMVSDNNGSPWQKTLLNYFELQEEEYRF